MYMVLIVAVSGAVAPLCAFHPLLDNNPLSRNQHLTDSLFVDDVTRPAQRCYDSLSIYVEPFKWFVYALKATGGVNDTVHCIVDKLVGIFLHTMSFNLKNRSYVKFYFWSRSVETINRYFNNVLDAIIDRVDEFIRKPIYVTPPKIQCRWDWSPYFKVLWIDQVCILIEFHDISILNSNVVSYLGLPWWYRWNTYPWEGFKKCIC